MALSEEDEMSDMECIQAADASGQEFQSGPDQCEDGPGVYRSPCSQQISMREYTQQSTELTHQAVQELKASVAFKMHTQQCHSPTVLVPSPTVLVPSPTVLVPSPTVLVPSPTVLVPSPTLLVPSPTVLVPSPTVLVPSPTLLIPALLVELSVTFLFLQLWD
eukprot:Em0005g1642a